mmetsp:Transcript_3035/g.5372  ORF Transcript_3035/g.5372 Transcript_3035/m.5372 type:complete len:229 (-) Transcript_3035:126-812(-)
MEEFRTCLEAVVMSRGGMGLCARYNHLIENESYIERFLLARNGDMKKGAEMLADHLQWRCDYKVDSILSEEKMQQIEQEKEMEWLEMTDKVGRPCLLWRVRLHNAAARGPETSSRFFVYMLEKGFSRTSPDGKMNLIVDLEGVNMKENSDLAMLRYAAPMIQNNYPERQNQTYILAVSAAISLTWKVAAKFLDQGTCEKVKLLKNSEMHRLAGVFHGPSCARFTDRIR